MKYAIISDIHANYDALEAVLAEIEKEGVDQFICLGDVVGYGPQPRECIQKVQELGCITVAGNHDFAAIGKTSIECFNTYAKEATYWTQRVLTDKDKKWLDNLPLVKHFDNFTIVHATLYAPELFDYIQTSYDAYLSLQILEGSVCFLGHSHVPITFFQEEMISYTLNPEIKLSNGVKALVNVGSVGQPRDDNPKAAYAIYDTDAQTVWIKRVEYDVEAVGEKIRKAGLPEILAERLKFGK
ncbi:MAG: metallophosphoesterase [Planctomycetota bacterium]|nr:MAG: metallophosphoesterase [Planctomycetota bacterium]